MNSSETSLGVASRSLGEHGEDRVDEADAHEGDDAGEGDGPHGARLVEEAVSHVAISLVEGGKSGGERRAGVVVEMIEAGLQGRGALGAHGGELLAAVRGQLDPDRAGVRGVGGLAHEAVGLEPADQAGHRRLGDALGGGQVGDPLRSVGSEPAQDQQRADAAAAVRRRAQQLRELREPALELNGEIFDRHTI